MGELLLPPEVGQSLLKLEKSAGHIKPAGLALGINPELHVADMLPLPDALFKPLKDGTSMMRLDTAESRLAIATLPPGSIIDLFDSTSIRRSRPAVIIEHTDTETRFRTAYKVGDTDWTRYRIGDTECDEADDARLALAQLFSLEQGAEGTGMLGAALGSPDKATDISLSERGHLAHEQPDASLPDNIVMGNATLRKTVMSRVPRAEDTSVRFARVIRTDEGIAAMRTVGVNADESWQLLSRAFMTKAEEYAGQNTSGYGGEQAVEQTLDVLVDATIALPEQIGSGISERDVNREVHEKLSSMRKSF